MFSSLCSDSRNARKAHNPSACGTGAFYLDSHRETIRRFAWTSNNRHRCIAIHLCVWCTLTFVSQEVLKGCSPLERVLRPRLIVFVGETELLLQEETSQACLQLFDSGKDEKQHIRQIQLHFNLKSSILNGI